MRFKHLMLTAALAAFAAVPAVHAGDLLSGTVNASLGGGGGNLASAKVDTSVGNVSAKLDAKVDANVGTGTTTTNTTVKLGSTTTASPAVSRIEARAQVLGPKQLLKLCIAVGAKGCDGASRSQQLAKVEARLGSPLTGQQLASACVAVGGGCGSVTSAPGVTSVPADTARPTRNRVTANVYNNNANRNIRITCRNILSNPQRYELGLVQLCRKLD